MFVKSLFVWCCQVALVGGYISPFNRANCAKYSLNPTRKDVAEDVLKRIPNDDQGLAFSTARSWCMEHKYDFLVDLGSVCRASEGFRNQGCSGRYPIEAFLEDIFLKN
ncbi:unnamed protein product [Sphacelaria rigidula]